MDMRDLDNDDKQIIDRASFVDRRSFLKIAAMTFGVAAMEVLPGTITVAYADENDGISFDTVIINKKEIFCFVADVSGRAKPLAGARIHIESLATGQSVDDVTNDKGYKVFNIEALAEKNSEGDDVYNFFGTMLVTKDGYRTVEMGKMRFFGGSSKRYEANTCKRNDEPYVRRLTFDDWDIQYSRGNEFAISPANDTDHTFNIVFEDMKPNNYTVQLYLGMWHKWEEVVVTPQNGTATVNFTNKYLQTGNSKVLNPDYSGDFNIYFKRDGAWVSTKVKTTLKTMYARFQQPKMGNGGVKLGVGGLNMGSSDPGDGADWAITGITGDPEPYREGFAPEFEDTSYDDIKVSPDEIVDPTITIPEKYPVIGGSQMKLWTPELPILYNVDPFGSMYIGYGITAISYKSGTGVPTGDEWKKTPRKPFSDQCDEVFNNWSKSFEAYKKSAGLRKGDKMTKFGCFAPTKMIQFNLGFKALAQLNWNYDGKPWNGGISLAVEAMLDVLYSIQFTLAFVPVYIYFNFTAIASATLSVFAEMRMWEPSSFGWAYNKSGTTFLVSTGIAVGLGIGVKGVLSAGVRGGATLSFTVAFVPPPGNNPFPHFTVGASATVDWEIEVFVCYWSGRIIGKDWPSLYGNWDSDKLPSGESDTEGTELPYFPEFARDDGVYTVPTEALTSSNGDHALPIKDFVQYCKPVSNEVLQTTVEFVATPLTTPIYAVERNPDTYNDNADGTREVQLGDPVVPEAVLYDYTYPTDADGNADTTQAPIPVLDPTTGNPVPIIEKAYDFDYYTGDGGATTEAGCLDASIASVSENGVKPKSDVVIFKETFSDARMKLFSVQYRGITRSSLAMARIATVQYPEAPGDTNSSNGGMRSRLTVSRFDANSGSWKKPAVVDYEYSHASVNNTDDRYLPVRKNVFDYDVGVGKGPGPMSTQSVVHLISGVRVDGEATNLVKICDHMFASHAVLEFSAEGADDTVTAVKHFEHTGYFPDGTDETFWSEPLATVLFAAGYRVHLSVNVLKRKSGLSEFGALDQPSSTLMISSYDYSGPVAWNTKTVNEDLGVVVLTKIPYKSGDDYLYAILFSENNHAYAYCYNLAQRRQGSIFERDPNLDIDPAFKHLTAVDGGLLAIKDGKLYQINYTQTSAGSLTRSEPVLMSVGNANVSEFDVDPTGTLVYFANTEKRKEPYVSDAKTGAISYREVDVHRLMACKHVGGPSGKFTPAFPYADVDHPLDHLVCAVTNSDSTMFTYKTITKAAKSQVDIHAITIPNVRSVILKGASFSDMFAVQGEETELVVRAYNSGNVVISSFDVTLKANGQEFKLRVECTKENLEIGTADIAAAYQNGRLDLLDIDGNTLDALGDENNGSSTAYFSDDYTVDDIFDADGPELSNAFIPGSTHLYTTKFTVPKEWHGEMTIDVELAGNIQPMLAQDGSTFGEEDPDILENSVEFFDVSPLSFPGLFDAVDTEETLSVQPNEYENVTIGEEDDPKKKEPEPNGGTPATADPLPGLGTVAAVAGAGAFAAYSARRSALEAARNTEQIEVDSDEE